MFTKHSLFKKKYVSFIFYTNSYYEHGTRSLAVDSYYLTTVFLNIFIPSVKNANVDAYLVVCMWGTYKTDVLP